MASRDCHGQKQRGFVLNAQTLQRVVAVGQPHTLRVLQNAEIDPPAARGAAFDLNPREGTAQAGEKRQCSARLGGGRNGQHAVMVPLDVVYVVPAEDVGHPV